MELEFCTQEANVGVCSSKLDRKRSRVPPLRESSPLGAPKPKDVFRGIQIDLEALVEYLQFLRQNQIEPEIKEEFCLMAQDLKLRLELYESETVSARWKRGCPSDLQI